MASSVKSFSGAVARLKHLRDAHLRYSDEVLNHYQNWIEGSEDSLGNDKWLVLEQVFIASVDTCAHPIAAALYEILHAQFANSCRLKRLKAMYHESKNSFEEAEKLYSTILEQDPVDSATLKRMIALQKTQGKLEEAVRLLNEYLQVNCLDFEAWLELTDIYLSQMDYDKASYCLEELILTNPHNHLYHQKYADIKYTQGEFDIARSYYSQAYNLCNANVRALYGTVLCSLKLASGKSKTKSEDLKLAKTAIKSLNKAYKDSTVEPVYKASIDQLMSSLV